MNKWNLRLLRLAYFGLIAILPIYALADYGASVGSGLVIRAFDATHGGTALCAAALTQCPGEVLMNSAGAEVGTAGAPVRVDPTGTTTQPISAASLPLPTGAATAAGQVGVATAANQALQATAALQGTNTATTGHTCAIVGFSELGCLGQIDDDLKVVASPSGEIAPNNTTAVVVKALPGTLYSVQLGGIGSAPAYLKIYNAASATCGTGTPVKRLIIPAAPTAANGAGSNISFGPGLALNVGIVYCVTTGIGDADTTAPAANTYLVNLDFL